MSTASVSNEGQITIPADIRQYLNLNTGGRVEFFMEADGRVCLMPQTTDVQALKSILKRPEKTISIEVMSVATAQRGAQKK